MQIQNQICKNCSHQNPLYRSTCENCKSHLRDRVVNLDLWATIGKIIEEPSKAFKQIIFSENKNFIIFFLFFISIKNLIYTRFFSVPFLSNENIQTSFFVSLIILITATLILFSIFTLINQSVFKRYKVDLRFKDIFSLNIYSFTPILLSLFTIFPVEIIVLGGDLFSNNPYAFQIKPVISYFLMGFEFLILCWTFFLLFIKDFMITHNRLISFLLSFLFLLINFITLFLISKFVFII